MKFLLILALPISLSAQDWKSPANEYVLPSGDISGPPGDVNATGVYDYSHNDPQATYDNNPHNGYPNNNVYNAYPNDNGFNGHVFYDNNADAGYGSGYGNSLDYGYNNCCCSRGWFADFDFNCGWEVEYRNAFFFPSSSLERRIYHGTRLDYEAEISKHLFTNWYAWTNFTYFSKGGGSDPIGIPTRLTLYPLSFGVKYVYPIMCKLSAYAGIGANYTWMHLTNDSAAVPGENKGRWGATAKLGVYYDLTERLFVDGFADYLYIPMNLQLVNNVGGWRVGLGVGFRL